MLVSSVTHVWPIVDLHRSIGLWFLKFYYFLVTLLSFAGYLLKTNVTVIKELWTHFDNKSDFPVDDINQLVKMKFICIFPFVFNIYLYIKSLNMFGMKIINNCWNTINICTCDQSILAHLIIRCADAILFFLASEIWPTCTVLPHRRFVKFAETVGVVVLWVSLWLAQAGLHDKFLVWGNEILWGLLKLTMPELTFIWLLPLPHPQFAQTYSVGPPQGKF